MKNKVNILVILILMLVAVSSPAQAKSDSAEIREYRIKAAFIYNFIKFVDWSNEKASDESKLITIGVVGAGDFIKAFDPIKGKQAKGKKIVIKSFDVLNKAKESKKKNTSRWNDRIKALKKCQVLFICTCEDDKPEIPIEILKELRDSGVLLIGEIPGFLENGGIINFVTESKKIRFEINVMAANRNGLKIRSKLLKLAKRVIKEEKAKDTKD